MINVVVQFIVFLTLSTLICRSTDISKCFSESLGIRDNRSRLYIKTRAVVGQRSSPAGYIPTNDILIDDGYLRI